MGSSPLGREKQEKWGALHEFVNGLIRAAFDVFPDQGFKFWAKADFHVTFYCMNSRRLCWCRRKAGPSTSLGMPELCKASLIWPGQSSESTNQYTPVG